MPHPDSAATTVASRSWRAAVVAAALLLPAAVLAQQPQSKVESNLSVVPEVEALRQEPI